MLKTRALSAVVMAPPALLAVWLGGYAFAALVAVAAAVMCWEWHTIIWKRFDRAGRVSAATAAVAALLAPARPDLAMLVVVLGAGMSASLATTGQRVPFARLWAGVGTLYSGLPSLALVWLRGDALMGRETIIWLFLVVWATDIGAYAAGRSIGGPLLLPVVSPKKTWAGLIGGVLSAAAVGAATAWAFHLPSLLLLALGGGVLAVLAQIGDLAESWVKRRWNVKDSSSIIPGHGGVLDRVDGLLAAALAMAVVTWTSGMAVLQWQ